MYRVQGESATEDTMSALKQPKSDSQVDLRSDAQERFEQAVDIALHTKAIRQPAKPKATRRRRGANERRTPPVSSSKAS
jgi:hypothetical protein